METYPGALTPAQEIAFWRRHIYLDQQTGEEARMFSLHSPYKFQPAWRHHGPADRIITLVSMKLVASKVKGGEAVVKSMNAAISSTMDGVFSPSEPGDDTPTNVPPWFVHWPGPPPGPYLVAAELLQYSNALTDKTAQGAFSEIINTITGKIATVTAGD
jgi:hypothetical protein